MPLLEIDARMPAITLDPAQSREWTPLLRGGDRARALALVEEIATALAAPASDDPSLRGAAGRALFFAYFAAAWPGRALPLSADEDRKSVV